MDPAHGPSCTNRGGGAAATHPRQEKTFEPIPGGFRMSSHAPSANSGPYKLLRFYGKEEVTTQIDFVLPNMRTEQVRCGALVYESQASRRSTRPVPPGFCRGVVCSAGSGHAVSKILRKTFHRAGWDLIERQQPGLKVQPRMMRSTCRPASALVFSVEGGIPRVAADRHMAHPLDGPVTLRWRSEI